MIRQRDGIRRAQLPPVAQSRLALSPEEAKEATADLDRLADEWTALADLLGADLDTCTTGWKRTSCAARPRRG